MELQEWKKMSWPGYRRENGSLGIRNKVLVVYTVECASHVAREIVRQADHPDVEVIGFGGCTDNRTWSLWALTGARTTSMR